MRWRPLRFIGLRWLSTDSAGGAGAVASQGGFLPNIGTRERTMLFNSLTKTKEPLPRGQPLTWYTCGPTVYDHAHIGHARAYVALDIVRRVLTQQGYTVFQVMGMTDIDDKIIAKAKVSACITAHARCPTTCIGYRFESSCATDATSRRNGGCRVSKARARSRVSSSTNSCGTWQL